MASLTQMLGTIGGGIVKRTFRNGDVQQRSGDQLTAEQLLKMQRTAPANLQALIDKQYIAVYPRNPAGTERFVVPAAFGKFDVVEGRRVTDAPVTKVEACALAGIEPETPAPTEKVKTARRRAKQ